MYHYFFSFQQQAPVKADAESLSLVINTANVKAQDFVQIPKSPKPLTHSSTILVEYRCHGENNVVGMEIMVNTATQRNKKVFQEVWYCSSAMTSSRKRTVRVTLPNKLAYRPGFYNRYSVAVTKSLIRVWVIDREIWNVTRRSHKSYEYAEVKGTYNTYLLPPNSRPEKPPDTCLVWWYNFRLKNAYLKTLHCALEPGTY